MTTPTNEEVRRQFEAGVRQWPNYSERTLAHDGRHPEYYGNPVVQGAWEGYQAALRSPAVVALVEAAKGSVAEIERLRDAMFRVYATAANGKDPTAAIEAMRDEMDKPWSVDTARAALAPFTTGAGHVE